MRNSTQPICLKICAVVAIFLLCALPATHAAERITYYHTDALGSPTAATDQQGNIVWRETYEPYGERIKKEPAASTNARWHTGHVLDAETGLQYAGARYYDPVIGRFMGIDPKGFSQGNPHSFNRYNYGNNNPYKYVDPDGKDSVLSLEYTRSSGPGDLGHSMLQPYTVYGYAIRDLPGTNNAGMATLMPSTGRIELSFDARQAGSRGSILGSEPKVGEISLSPKGANHASEVSDNGFSKRDTFTEAGEGGRVRTNIRIHAGGPDKSQGCITSTTCSYENRRQFEADLRSGVGALNRQGGERAYIDIPSR